jgi:hypothetical protein
MFGSVGWSRFRAEGFFCNLDVLYGGVGIGKLYLVFDPKKINFFSVVIFFQCILVLYKGSPSYRRSLQPSKENI